VGQEADNSLLSTLFVPQISSSFSISGKSIQARWTFDDGQVTAVYDRHSYDAEKREALEAWAARLMTVVSNKQAPQSSG
jgi:hypothetical protein